MDRDELQQHYEKYHRDLVNIFFHYSGDLSEAEDVTQEAFIRLGRSMTRFENDKALKSWLYRVGVNLVIDRGRKRRRFFGLLEKLGREDESGKIGRHEQYELSDEIKEILRDLSEKERIVLVLKYVEGMDYQELSEVMGIKVGSLKSMVSRAIKKVGKRSE